MRSDLPSGTVTFLFTDVEGSTKLLHELGAEGYAEALAEHRRLIRDACSAESGVEVDTQGDAFFFAFPTASGALAAARALTEALAPGPIQVRVGLHTGTPLLTEEGYVGDDVHFAARVAAAGHGGQVVLSSATAVLIEPGGSEPHALTVVDLGEHRLKDIAEAVSIYQLGERSFPPLKTISNTNLPRPASSFVGREAELAEVLALIEAGARLVTLTGPGGTGKTRLALEAASSLVTEYKAGVFWVGLASLRDPALVSATIAQTLGAKDALHEHIAERELLLLCDNLEQVVEAAPELSQLLEACPNLTLLVTSRELLRVSGEVEYAVPPLAEPEAVSLFGERARLDRSDEISELCARLDNLPLAVELAAARCKALTPAQILERLSQRLDLLKGGRDADPRQQTLRATIEWSYELLSPAEQELFARLSVFHGGCTLEAAEEVADADLDTLQSLVEKSLLRFSDERYWMLETIREYAGERLREAGEAEELGRRHAEWFHDLSVRAAVEFRGANQGKWLAALERDLDNVRVALETLAETSAELEILVALGDFWDLRGHAREAQGRLLEALTHHVDRTPERAEALRVAAEVTLTLGDLEQSRHLSEEALSLAREQGLEILAARCMNNLGTAALYRSDAATAAELFAESAELRERHGDEAGAARVRGNLATVRLMQGELQEAERLLRQTIAYFEAVGDAWSVANANCGLGDVARARGDLPEAHARYEATLRVFAHIGTIEPLVEMLERLASLEAECGDAARAGTLLGAAEAIREETGASGHEQGAEWRLETEALVRERLGADGAERARELGHSMRPDDAVAVALGLAVEPTDL